MLVNAGGSVGIQSNEKYTISNDNSNRHDNELYMIMGFAFTNSYSLTNEAMGWLTRS